MSIIYCGVSESVDWLVPTLQVMRKKTETGGVGSSTSTSVAQKTITKKPRAQPISQTTRGAVASRSVPGGVKDDPVSLTAHSGGMQKGCDDIPDDSVSVSGSRERSTSPVESDLLRYLTVHIAPPLLVASSSKGFLFADVTSFVIERDEYLEGIVRLIQSDCPEVAHDMKSFTDAMQKAFSCVTAVTSGENVTNFNI